MKAYKSLVVGAGRIGAFYDAPGDARTLTHCHAFVNHPRVELAGIVDADPSKAGEASRRWSTTPYDSLAAALDSVRPDIVSVCTPTPTHLAVVREVAAAKPAFVFLEKPLGARPGEAAAIGELLQQSGSACMVNFPRSFDPIVQETALAARTGLYGEFITGTAFYAKGVRNNGSHMVDLVHTILGPIAAVEVLDTRQDYSSDDVSADVFIRLERGGTFHLIPVDERAYSITDVTLFFQEKRVHFRNFGLEMCLSSRREDPVFPGYWDLTDQGDYVQTGLSNAMDRAVAQIVAFLDDGGPYDSTLESAIRTELVVDEIARLARKRHAAPVELSVAGGPA